MLFYPNADDRRVCGFDVARILFVESSESLTLTTASTRIGLSADAPKPPGYAGRYAQENNMFEEFLNNGSVLSVLLMVYAGNVMMEALRMNRLDPRGINSPLIIKHPVSVVFMFASIPCAIWPAIYIGLYSGWVAGIVSWIALQIAGAFATIALGIRGPALGFHFIAGCIAFPIGYYLSFTALPA